ncbi:MAG: hypothetical protein AAF560_17350 [Acidobacteriota bacterium]
MIYHPTCPIGRIAVLLLGCMLFAGTVRASPPAKGDACEPLVNDGYDGSLESMTCLEVAGPDLEITDVEVWIGAESTWVGDLTLKLVHPEGQVLTLMSRPGIDEPADDGSSCCGDSSDWGRGDILLFRDEAAVSAEAMGSMIGGAELVCRDDAVCEYAPFPDTGPGVSLADFDGLQAAGTWRVCAASSQGGDLGALCSADLVFEGQPPVTEIPTLGAAGMALLVLTLTALGLRRLHGQQAAKLLR